MQIVAISCVRNEEDIVEAFVRHTLAYCWEMIVIDHGSTDSTAGILDKLCSEGMSLRVIHDATIGHMQVAHMNRLLRLAAEEHGADWILPLDADEFLSGAQDVSFLPDSENAPCLKMRMRTYYAKPDDDPDVLNPVERITRRLIAEPLEVFKAIVPGYLARIPDSRVVQGNHRLVLGAQEAAFEVLDSVYLGHYSLRTPAQYAIKLATKYLQRLRHFAPNSVEGLFYREAYMQVRKSYSGFSKSFGTQPLPYLPPHDQNAVVRDPLRYMGGPLQYTTRQGDFDEFASQLLILAERLAVTGEQQESASEGGAQASVSRLLAVEVFSHPERGVRQSCQVPADPATTHLLEFDLDCSGDTDELRIGFACDAGMLEIDGITVVHGGSTPVEQTYGFGELKSMLRVLQNGAAIYSMQTYRLFISPEPVLLGFFNWRNTHDGPPQKLRIKVRYENRHLEGRFLDTRVLNAITLEREANETLRRELEYSKANCERLMRETTYIMGSKVDFSDKGTGIAFMQNGWNASESWGTWTEGHESVLHVVFTDVPQRDFDLSAWVKAFVPPGHPETRVNVCAGGNAVEEWVVKTFELEKFTATIPASSLRGHQCEITFQISNPVSPKGAGVSEDERLLGLGFSGIEFREQP